MSDSDMEHSDSNRCDLDMLTGCVAIIPAAGIGKRFSNDKPKQYSIIHSFQGDDSSHEQNGCRKGERCVLDFTLNLFLESEQIDKVVLVISSDDEYYSTLENIEHSKLIVIEGGAERVNSVHNALKYLHDKGIKADTPTLVHDAVRPCLSKNDLHLLIDKYQELDNPCFLSAKVSDSIKRIDDSGKVTENVDRDDLVRALTPQIAKFNDLNKAISTVIKNDVLVTDEIGALINCDFIANAIPSNGSNIKITYVEDLELASEILSRMNPI